jgi:four helix bundle protein
MQSFRELVVWQKSHKLVLALYKMTMDFPSEERFGLSIQIRRAAASIPANIAEGCGRSGNGDLSRFLYIALGSASELDYHLELAFALHFLSSADYRTCGESVIEIKRMLSSLIERVESQRRKARGANA